MAQSALCVPRRHSWRRLCDNNGVPLMRLGAVTYNVLKDMDADHIIRILTDLGYEAVELRTGHKHGVEPSLNASERAAVAAKFRSSRVRLLSFGTTCEFQSPDPKVRAANIETAKQFIDLAHDTGALAIKVRPNGLPHDVPPETTIRTIGECLHEVGEEGIRKGVEIWMEVHGRDTQNPPGRGGDHAGRPPQECGPVLELESHRRRQRQRPAKLRTAAAVDPELPHQ